VTDRRKGSLHASTRDLKKCRPSLPSLPSLFPTSFNMRACLFWFRACKDVTFGGGCFAAADVDSSRRPGINSQEEKEGGAAPGGGDDSACRSSNPTPAPLATSHAAAHKLRHKLLKSPHRVRPFGATNFSSTVIELLQHRQDSANRCVGQCLHFTRSHVH
jgi:hypothetical protein